MDEQGLPTGEIGSVDRIAGGTQNVLLRFARGGREYVLRRGPQPSAARLSNDVMRREERVLGGARRLGVPHPRFIAGLLRRDA